METVNSRVYICATVYHVLISIIKQLINPQNIDIIICTNIPSAYELSETIKQANLFDRVYVFNKDSIWRDYCFSRRIRRFCSRDQEYVNYIDAMWDVNLGSYDEVYIFNDMTELGMYLQCKRIKYHVIEDSLDYFKYVYLPHGNVCKGNFLEHIKNWLKKTTGIGYLFFGQSKFCVDIEVNDANDLKIPADKVIVVPREKIFASLTPNMKKIISEIFVYNQIDFGENKCRKLLLITQPCAKDGLVENSEMQKQLYTDVIEEYGRNYFLVVKPHPRDDINYKKLFPNATVLDSQLPIEVLNYHKEYQFDVAITIDSTSLVALENVKEKIKLGREILEKYKG